MKAIEQYFNYLKDAGADVPSTVDSFKKTLSDKNSAEQYYGYLKQNNFDAPDSFDSFAKTLGINKTQTVPVKKKDGSDPLSLDTPSVSGLNPEDPIPSISALLKQRKKLKAEKDAPKPTSAPGFPLATVETAPVIDYDAQISKIDEQIKAKGFDPDELEKEIGSFIIPFDDNQISKLYEKKKSDPLQFNRQLAAYGWEDASINAIRNNPNLTPEQKSEKIKLVKDNRNAGSNLNNWNSALNYANNTLSLIYDVTAGDGDSRDRAISNYKKDLIPALANSFYKDGKSNEFAGKNIPYEFGLLVNGIFDKYKTEQIAKANELEFTDPNAIAGRQRSVMEVEQDGITYLQQGLSDYISNNPKLSEARQFFSETNPILSELKTKIDAIKSSDPDLVIRYEDAIKSYETENAKLKEIESTPEFQQLKKAQDEIKVLEEQYKNASPDKKNQFGILYNNAANSYNSLLQLVNEKGYSAQLEKLKGIKSEVDEMDKSINTPELKQYIVQYNDIVNKVNQYDPEAKELDNISAWSKYLEDKQKTMFARYPRVAMNNAIEAAQDITGPNLNKIKEASVNLGYNVQRAIDMADILFGRLFRTPEQQAEKDWALVGKDDLFNSAYKYNPNGQDLMAKPFVWSQTKEVRDKVNAIMNDKSLTEEEQRQRVRGVMYMGVRDGSVYQATNPRFGKGYNLSLETVLNTIVDVAPDILVSVGAALATEGGASANVFKSLGPLFAITYVQGFSSYYTDAVRRGIANPLAYANMHTLVDATSELTFTKDIKNIRKFFANKNGFASEFFRNLSDKQFTELISNSKRTFKSFAVNVGLNTAQEPIEEVFANVGGNVLDKNLFSQKVGITEGAADTFVNMWIGQIPFSILGLPGQYRQANVGSKMMFYNIGMNKDKSIAALENDFKSGNITQVEYDERRKVVDALAKAVEETPMNYADGNPMRDEDKVNYAFNRYVINRGSEESKSIPTDAQKDIQSVVTDAQNFNNKIFGNATNQSQVQEGRTEGDLGQPQGIVQGQPEVGQGAGSQGQAEVTTANVGDSNISGQGQVAPPGKRLFNEPNPEAAVIETEFKKSKGIDTPEPAPITKLDEEKSKKIADAYDQLVDNPNDPEVQQAYQAMADETMEQFGAIDKAGVKVEIWTGKGEPYKNSGEMIADVRDNKHMYIFSTEEGFGDTPITEEQRQQNALLRDSGIKDVNGKPLLINDIFRFVHDYFGHTRLGNSFGAIGEENAWNVHARMYSPLARRAMTTETRGQNSWVNFNKNFRNPDGSMKKKGDEGYVPPAQRPFADQKMALLPEEFSIIEDSYSLQSQPTKIDQALNQAIPNAEKSLQEAGIKIQVVDAATDTEEARAARGNQGLFRSEDGTIIIDKSKLANEIESGLVVWHEASHPVMNIIRNTDKPLYDAVVRGLKQAAKKNKGVAGALNWAQSQEQYDNEDTQNDESVVETIGRINAGLIDINSLDTGLRQKLIDFINSIAKYFGIDPILNDRDIAAFKKTVSEVADALKAGRNIGEIVGQENVKNYGVPIGVPTQAKVADKYGPKVKHDGGTYKLSFVKPSDIIDIKGLIKEIADSGQKVWFWTADQLGRGMYYDNVIDGEHYLDAGPSFALDPKNRDNGVIWATGKGENWVNDKIANSDYIFIISGSPQKSKLFNKRVAEITFNRVKKSVGEEGAWDKFKSEVLGVSKIGKINEILNKYNSFEDLLASTDRKELLIQFDAQKEKKGTPLKGLLEKYGAFVDYNDLRDGFFKDNDFKLNDVMLVLKPTGYGGKSAHSTYENDILGEVVGVPDRKVNAYDIMPDEFRAKYAPDMSRTEQSQAVAPYGAGVRNVQASVGNRSEEDLRAEGTGKERPRALASRYGNLNPATQAKIEDDATVYFQRTNKQTKEAVDKFLDGLNIMDAADYVLSNPKIPEVSQVWMAAEVAKRLNAEIDAAGNNQDLIDDLTRKQGDVFNEFAKKATSLGQAVQAFIAFKDNPNAVEFFLPKILRQLKKAGVENVTEEQRAEILTLLKDVNSAAEGLPKDKAIIKLSHYLAGIAPLKPMDVLQAIWYAKILSGITTQSTNFFANIFNTVFELPVVALRISMLNGTPLGMLAGAKGFASGVAKGAVTAADIIKSGVRSKEVDKYFAENPLEYFTWSKWLGNKGKVLDYIPPLNFGAWKYVGRLLAATDAFFATANQEAIANMLAYAEAAGTPAGNNFKKANALLGNNKMSVLRARAQAKAEGFEPGTIQYKRRELEIIAQKRAGTQEADEIGKRITMNYDPEGFTKPLFDAVVGLQENIPAIKMVIPFARIVANLTENGLNYSPFGFAKAVTGIKNPFQGLKSERMNFDQRTDMFYKSMLGMGMLLYILPHVGEDDDDWFEITAGGSTDLQKKYELQKGGWRPYTITLKDGTKISYKDWPTAGLLAGLGHVRDAKKYKIDDSTQTTLFATGFFLNLYDKSLLKGLQDLFGIIPKFNRGSYAPDDRMGERFTKYAAQQVKSVALSNLSQQSFKLYSELVTGDPQRDAKTFAQIIYRDIPSLNDGIRPIIDVFGDEVPYTTKERLLPVMDSPEKEEIIEWLNNNKMFVGVPMRKNIKLLDGTERPMTDDEYYEYRKNAGKAVKKFINEFMSEIKNEQIGKEAFEKVVDAARQQAYGEILMKANNL